MSRGERRHISVALRKVLSSYSLLTFPPPNWRISLTTKIEVSVRQQIWFLDSSNKKFYIWGNICTKGYFFCIVNRKNKKDSESANENSFKCLLIESYEVSNDTVMIPLEIGTYSRDFLWRVVTTIAVVDKHRHRWNGRTAMNCLV